MAADARNEPETTRGPDDDAIAGVKVLLVTASARRRGAEIQATQLTGELRRRGVDAHVVALSSGTDGAPLPIDCLGRTRLGPATLWRLRRRARQHDIVVAYGSTTLPACVIALAGSSVPFVYRSVSDPARWLRGRIHRALTGFQYRRAQFVVALWPGAAESAIKTLGVDPERVRVIPNARSPDTYRPPTPDERRRARDSFDQDERPLIAFIGSLTPEKRIELAIETMCELPGHRLVVAGGGSGLAAAEQLAHDRLGDRVSLCGELTDITPLLHAADALLITSVVEGMPGVAIEAALCGVPTVATAVGALPTMPGVETAEADPALLAAAIRRRLDDGRVEVSSVESITWPVVAASWQRLLDDFV